MQEAYPINPGASALLTDLYQLTMLQAYFDQGMEETAVFEFFSRKLPVNRGFLMAAGLEQVLDYLENLRFTPTELEWLAASGRFSRDFIDYLERLRFAGDVHAMAEGTIFFPPEPIIRVTAPIPQAQLVETRLINVLHFETLVASKAARTVLVAPDKGLIDFGLRRAHGAEAGVLAARAAYLAGFAGSATVLAGFLYGVPTYGTMAHSFVQAHDDEAVSFVHFAHSQPDNVVLLIDTYDTEVGAEKVVALASRLRQEGIRIRGVRLDSGDLADLARKVRCILDVGGLTDVRILASGNLDEEVVRTLLESGAPIDDFAIGTRLDTSADAPYLDCAYKLQEYGGLARRKRSTGKATWPGRKQVYRRLDPDGRMVGDILTLEDDLQQGQPLLQLVMRAGRRLNPSPPLSEVRRCAAAELGRLPQHLRQLQVEPSYPVSISAALRELAEAVDRRTSQTSLL
jgi:nicotinate phosphoribosyltransferase